MLKDSMTVNDFDFPVILSLNQPDGLARAGDMEGPDFEYHLFSAATGSPASRDEFYRMVERAINVERAVQVRLFDRARADDETIIPYFETPEYWQNPLLNEHKAMARAPFLQMLDEYYDRRGWDRTTGRPTETRLTELGLTDIAHTLRATNRISKAHLLAEQAHV